MKRKMISQVHVYNVPLNLQAVANALGLPLSIIEKMFRDGRALSPISEHYAAAFSGGHLSLVDEMGIDVYDGGGAPVSVKGLTNYTSVGLSKWDGGGRKSSQPSHKEIEDVIKATTWYYAADGRDEKYRIVFYKYPSSMAMKWLLEGQLSAIAHISRGKFLSLVSHEVGENKRYTDEEFTTILEEAKARDAYRRRKP